MSQKSKSYLGFARRAGKLVLGVNAVKATKGEVYLLLADRAASPNTQKEIQALAGKFSCPLLQTDDLEGLVGKPFCKLAAVREEHLARAILQDIKE